MVLARRHLTLEEFLALPEEEPALEYFEGRITQKMSPKARHSLLQGALVEYFNPLGRPRKIALAFPELRTTYAGASFVPDVAVFRWARIPIDVDGEVADEIFLPPDVAVEVVSPRQSRPRLRQRCRWYVENGVSLALLIDPRHHAVTRFEPGQPERLLRGADVIDCSAIVPGALLTVDELFACLRLS
jgi:Uma2 family endonuclease